MNFIAKAKRFNMGNIRITEGVRQIIKNDSEFEFDVMATLMRYKSLDWGTISESDKLSNDLSVELELNGLRTTRLFSEYIVKNEQIWIITESDRSSTTVLLPEEY